MTWPLLRGQVVRADIGLEEPKLLVVVSNHRRNEKLDDVLAARVTTSQKPAMASIVPLPTHESLQGMVVCDDILALYEDEVLKVVTGLTPLTMRSIDDGLRAALALGWSGF